MQKKFSEFLSEISNKPLTIIDASIGLEDYVSIDLSVSNTSFKKSNIESSKSFQDYIDTYLKENSARVAYGGYNEERGIYKRSTHFKDENIEERNIHLGLDLWIDAETPVLTPFDATVYGFADNAGLGNYGPTLILKHNIDGVIFYTLYGHLSRASLKHLEVGQFYNKGTEVAKLGAAEVNGDYPPHLHFQVIKSIGDYRFLIMYFCDTKNLND